MDNNTPNEEKTELQKAREAVDNAINEAIHMYGSLERTDPIDDSKTLAGYEFDSLDAIEFIMELEEILGTSITEEDLEPLAKQGEHNVYISWYEHSPISKIREHLTKVFLKRGHTFPGAVK